jgi:hypothetical protein
MLVTRLPSHDGNGLESKSRRSCRNFSPGTGMSDLHNASIACSFPMASAAVRGSINDRAARARYRASSTPTRLLRREDGQVSLANDRIFTKGAVWVVSRRLDQRDRPAPWSVVRFLRRVADGHEFAVPLPLRLRGADLAACSRLTTSSAIRRILLPVAAFTPAVAAP